MTWAALWYKRGGRGHQIIAADLVATAITPTVTAQAETPSLVATLEVIAECPRP